MNTWSGKAIILVCLFTVVFYFVHLPDNVLNWDVFGYYLYLPAGFIYNDISLSEPQWLNALMEKYEPSATLYQLVDAGNGNRITKYTLGFALIMLPFFFIGHGIALMTAFPADGLSMPYQYAMAAGGLVYALIGIFYLRKVLLAFFTEKTTAVLILLIAFGTNYFQLVVYESTLLQHNFLFTLYALLIWHTLKWHETNRLKDMIWLSISAGLITLIRPAEIVCVLIPLLWGMFTKQDIKRRVSLFKDHLRQIGTGIGLFVICGLPQLIYWKTVTGDWFFYSYQNPGEGFEFLAPYTLEFLFSFRKGWFVYTPLMIFAVAGFYYMWKANSKLFFAFFIFFLIDLWVISSWSCWWYAGGSFSSRSMVPAYTVLAFPLGFLLRVVWKHRIYKISFFTLSVLFVLLNLFQTWQFDMGIIPRDRVTMNYYFRVFGKTHVTEEDKQYLLVNRSVETVEKFEPSDRYQKQPVTHMDFEELPSDSLNLAAYKGSHAKKLTEGMEFFEIYQAPFNKLTKKDHAWLKTEAYVFVPESYNGPLPGLVVAFHHEGKPYKYRTEAFPESKTYRNKWIRLSLDYLTPEVRSGEDVLKIYIWNRGKSKMYVDEIHIDKYAPKN